MPGASRHAPDLGAERRLAWDRYYRAGIAAVDAGDTATAIAKLESARMIDDGFAQLYHYLGRALEASGRTQAAYEAYWRHIDLLRRMITRELNVIIVEVCKSEGVPWVDGAALIEAARAGSSERLRPVRRFHASQREGTPHTRRGFQQRVPGRNDAMMCGGASHLARAAPCAGR